ncbi:MAG: chlorophyllase [Actinomycetota bacterium]|nr:chlorophyllase [Actinomycetota bacterium]
MRNEVFTDASRPTAENNGAPALPSRRLPTAIYYPAVGDAGPTESTDATPLTDEGPYPLVLFSHGFTGTGPAYSVALRDWAAAGYVVAAPTFPLSAGGSAGGPKLTDYVSQPADVRFVLDQVLGLSDGGDHPLSGMVDGEHVAAAGHSLGGVTTIGLGFNDCCSDPLIDAYIPIAGLELPFPDGAFDYEARTSPLLLIHGSADTTVGLEFSKTVFAKAKGPKYLVTLVDQGHTPFFNAIVGGVIDNSVIDFLDHYLKDRADGLDRLGEDAVVDGLATLETAQPAS